MKQSVFWANIHIKICPHTVAALYESLQEQPEPWESFKKVACNLPKKETVEDIRLQNNWNWKGSQEVLSPTFCSKQTQLWHQTTWFRALSRWLLQTSKHVYCTAWLYSGWRNFFLTSSLKLFSSCHTVLWAAWLCLFVDILMHTARLCLGLPEFSLLQSNKLRSFSLSSKGKCSRSQPP